MGCIWLLNLTSGCIVFGEHGKGTPDLHIVAFLRYMSDCQHLKMKAVAFLVNLFVSQLYFNVRDFGVDTVTEMN